MLDRGYLLRVIVFVFKEIRDEWGRKILFDYKKVDECFDFISIGGFNF